MTKYTIVHHITSNIAKFFQQSRDFFSFCFKIECIKRGVNKWMGCSKLADRARLPIWFLSTERKHACIRSNWLQEQNWFMVTTTSGFGDYENACLYQNIDASDVTMSLWRQIITSKSLDQKRENGSFPIGPIL